MFRLCHIKNIVSESVKASRNRSLLKMMTTTPLLWQNDFAMWQTILQKTSFNWCLSVTNRQFATNLFINSRKILFFWWYSDRTAVIHTVGLRSTLVVAQFDALSQWLSFNKRCSGFNRNRNVFIGTGENDAIVSVSTLKTSRAVTIDDPSVENRK